jgi:hypothetical protein
VFLFELGMVAIPFDCKDAVKFYKLDRDITDKPPAGLA